MALDSAIVRSVDAGESPPTFRLFTWDHPSITIGYAQRVSEVIDLALCERDGVTVARRPTGGRAVFHDRELAFSVVGFIDDALFGTSLADTFRFMGTVVGRACGSIGLDVSLGGGNVEPSQRFGLGKAPCFLSSSRHEVAWRGKKIAGIAQRRYSSVFLQQGSILTGGGYERILRYLPGTEDHQELESALRSRAADLGSALGGEVKIASLAHGLYLSFAEASGTGLVRGTVTEHELREAERVMPEHAVPGKREAVHEKWHRF